MCLSKSFTPGELSIFSIIETDIDTGGKIWGCRIGRWMMDLHDVVDTREEDRVSAEL